MRSLYQTLGSFTWAALAASAPIVALADDGKCAALTGTTLDDVTIERASLQPKDAPVEGASLPGPTGAPLPDPMSGLPAFCRVIGTARPTTSSEVRFEVWLPSERWSGRFTGGSNGGFAGSISYGDLAAALTAGHAGASTDTGHVGSSGIDASWARGQPERVRDYGWRAIHVTTVVAKKLITAYYGRGPDYSYFVGCSNGGRQGLVEAARYPEDYDGIIAGAPVTSFTDLIATFVNNVQAQLPDGAALQPSQMTRLQAEVLRQCDARDGQVDGLLSAPAGCKLDLAPLACAASDAADCLTPPQHEALTQIIEGRRDRDGRTAVYGVPVAGAEGGPTGWGGWFATGQPMSTAHALFSRGMLEDFVPQPIAKVETFDFEGDLRKLEAAVGADLNAEPRLGRFFARGGRLIVWHGQAEPSIPPGLTLAYHRDVVADAGAQAHEGLRLFLVPGVQHCAGGLGPDLLGQDGAPQPGADPEHNLGAALQAWVEKGRAPDSVIGRFSSDPGKQRERRVCAYPKRATLRAGADPNRGQSYVCAD